MKTTHAILAAIAALALPTAALAGSGWNTNDGGSLQFLDPANWDGGDINGIFPDTWEPTSELYLRLTNDWTGTLTILGNVAQKTTFRGYKDDNTGSQKRTITLNGDILIQPSASANQLIFDSFVGFDLGGETRVFRLCSPSSADRFRVQGQFTNGDAIIEGGGGIMLLEAASFSGNVKICENTTLLVNYANNNHDVTRANNVEINRGILSVNAYNGDDIARFGAIDVSGKSVSGVSIISVSDNNRNHISTLSAQSFSAKDGGVLALMAKNLAGDGASASRVFFTTAPASAGSGQPGTSGARVLLDLVAGASNSESNLEGYGANQPQLATYDDTLGVRALSSSETAEAVSGEAAVNLVVPSATTLELSAGATVNSLQMRSAAYNSASPQITGEGVLTVESGMVLAVAPKDGAKIDVPLDFGGATGRIVVGGATKGTYRAIISKPVAGSGGLVLTKLAQTSYDHTIKTSSNAIGVDASNSGQSTYTGDTYVQCVVTLGSSSFLPHGTRPGNTILNGSLNFNTIAINGLYGTGKVWGTTLTVGEDGSDSDFDGSVEELTTLNIEGGRFNLDGSVKNGTVNVASGAAIGGSGGITNNVAFFAGAKLAVTVVDGVATCLAVAGEVGGGPVTVNANVTGGKWRDAQCILRSGEEITATFVRGANVGSLELRNGGTELWAVPRLKQPTILSLH